MNLSKFSDYAFRLLLLAAARPGQMITIREAAQTYGISQAHLKKVVTLLTRKGYLIATRGHGGGFTLGLAPGEIRLGAVLRDTEPAFELVECYTDQRRCVISGVCRLPRAFDDALAAFVEVLDRYTLQDVALTPRIFESALDREVAAPNRRSPE
jgi:Rrf2 family transcriptional regulator, nitric oxide-sensitive transcriptional repressor